MTRGDARSWVVANPARTRLTLSYRVKGDDAGLGFFGTSVHNDSTFVNGPSAFMFIDGRLKEKTRLAFQLPEGWDVATGMDRAADGSYTAGGYDELADHPIQLGRFERRAFKVPEHTIRAVYVTRGERPRPDLEAETERLRRVSQPAIRMFSGVPFKKYVYIVHLAYGFARDWNTARRQCWPSRTCRG